MIFDIRYPKNVSSDFANIFTQYPILQDSTVFPNTNLQHVQSQTKDATKMTPANSHVALTVVVVTDVT